MPRKSNFPSEPGEGSHRHELPPEWVAAFAEAGHEAIHWSDAGDPRAPDSALMTWARERGFIVLTHDLDFGHLLVWGVTNLWHKKCVFFRHTSLLVAYDALRIARFSRLVWRKNPSFF